MTSPSVTTLTRRAPESVAQSAQSLHELKPRVDIYESADELLMLADMPGAAADSVAVRLEGAQLTLEATRTTQSGGVRYFRAFRMPATVDANGISADLKDGVLQVHLRKSEAAKPKAIPIRSS
jgi:HSP20 family protein